MINFNWDVVEAVAKETGQSICLGVKSDFTRLELREMSKEARKRKVCLSMGNHDRNPDEADDEIYATAKL